MNELLLSWGQTGGAPAWLLAVVAVSVGGLILLVGWLLGGLTRLARGQSRQGLFGPLTDALAAQLPESRKETKDFAQLLRQAGLYSPVARASIYALRFALLFVPLVVAGILAVTLPPEWTVRILIGGGLLAGALSIIPRLYVYFRRNRRLKEIRNGLADMMDMLSMCLGGGMPLSPSLDHVAKNLTPYPALAEELQILRRQAEVGSMKLALTDMAERVDMPEVRQVTSLLGRGEQLGTRLSTSLLDQADHFRSTRRQRVTMHANRSPVILTLPLLFCFAPAVLILLMAPAMLELTDFIRPPEGQPSVLDGNESLGTGRIVRTLNQLDQDGTRQARP
ncbi:MAG: type II secretion system F family protein [Pirellulaceae bacterium]|nr:type II secretion system F family protein [Pirellulaceae bacterium]